MSAVGTQVSSKDLTDVLASFHTEFKGNSIWQ